MNNLTNWIWLEQARQQSTSCLLARKAFTLNALPAIARLSISANNIYRVTINGEFVGRGPDRADPRFPYFDSYDVQPFLRPGSNVILATIQHILPSAFPTDRFWCLYNGRGGFIAQLQLDDQVIGTDETWKMTPHPGWDFERDKGSRFRGPIPRIDLRVQHVVEAASQAGFDDVNWFAPVVVGPMPGTSSTLPFPLPREIPPLIRTVRVPSHSGTIRPQSGKIENADPRFALGFYQDHPPTIQPSTEAAWLVYDFGRTMGGFPSLELEVHGGALDLYCGEGRQWQIEEKLHLPQSGACRYESLDWRGGRYLALHFHDLTGPAIIRAVRFIEMVYPFQDCDDFRCSDQTLTHLWRICRDTAQINTKDHPVDCCGREQALWISDLQVHARAIAACFGDVRPVETALRQAFRVMHDDGVVPVPGPVGLGYDRTGQELKWSEQPLTLALTLRDLYWFAGGTEILHLVVPKLTRLYDHFARYQDDRGLLQTHPNGLPALMTFCGWNPKLEEGTTCVLNFEYAASLTAAAELAQAIGRNDLAHDWASKAKRVRQAARAAFWDPSLRLFIDGEQNGARKTTVASTTNALAVLAGGLDHAEAGSWAEAIRTNPQVLQPVTPFDATLLLEAFLKLRLDLHACELLDSYFGSIVRQGEPTLPEYWSAGVRGIGNGDDRSRCHAYGTGPAYLLIQHVLGCNPIDPGWRRVSIEPRRLGLTDARGSVPTPLGDIRIEWECDDMNWNLDLDLPDGIQAAVTLPRIGWGNQLLVLDGETVQLVKGWEEFRAQAHREITTQFPRALSCLIEQSSRHTVKTESI